MNRIKLAAYAKLNLSLDVTGVREQDGYHFMDMVNRSVSLSDELVIRRTPGTGFRIVANLPYIPTDEKNLVWKAAYALANEAGLGMPEVRVDIKKRIPTQAGLGGGSADAAAVLIGLNTLMELGMESRELERIGLSIGTDIPFCLKGGCARVTGVGEVMEPFRDRCRYWLVLAMPRKGHPTGEFFNALDSGMSYAHPETDAVVRGLAGGDLAAAIAGAGNIFEEAVPDPKTREIKNDLYSLGADYAAMTGTGACVFGVFRSSSAAFAASRSMREKKLGSWSVKPVDCGVDILEQNA